MNLVTPKQMKQLEAYSEKTGTSCLTLMQNAGEKLAGFIHSVADRISCGVVFFCGSGNNGGDGFVAARLLAETGVPVTVALMCGDPSTELSARMYAELSGTGADVLNLYDNNDKIFSKLSSASVIVDAVFGTGYHGELPPQVKACMSFASRAVAKKIAVDVVSGGDCLNGNVAEGALKCDYTVTFDSKKVGMELYPLYDYCGEVTVVDIGIPESGMREVQNRIIMPDLDFVKRLIPERNILSHKGTYGRLLNIAGSRRMPGAAALSTLAALRSGAGLVTLATAKTAAESLSSGIYEAMYLPLKENTWGGISSSNEKDILKECQKATAVSIGCGMGNNDDTRALVEKLIKSVSCTVIIDADGINSIGTDIDIFRDITAGVILTPHIAELSRLFGITAEEGQRRRLELARELSEKYGVTVVAKGVPTIISGVNGFSFVCRAGNAGLARGGSGDVLTGIIASLAAQGLTATDAAAAGVLIHGAAADRTAKKLSCQGMLPSDVINELPYLFAELGR